MNGRHRTRPTRLLLCLLAALPFLLGAGERSPGLGDVRAVRRLGFKPASTLQDALEMASDVVGRDASITHFHNPPILMADVS